MKKLTLILAAVVMGFLMTSCGENIDEKVKKATDEFFAQGEKEVQAIDNAADFVDFFYSFNERKDEFAATVFSDYPNDGENAEIPNEVYDYVYDRATAYNRIEAAKCGEVLTPWVEQFEQYVDALYYNEEELDEESFIALYDPMMEALYQIADFQDIDNIPQDLAERFQDAFAKYDELFGEMEYDDEEE